MGIRLVVFDLDGTLIRGSSCCELIAARIDRLDQMRAFERCVTKDEITAARQEMSGWYSRYSVDQLSTSLVNAVEAPGLKEGIERLQAGGVKIAIASITWSFAVRWFAKRLGAEFHLGTELRPDGRVIHVWPEDKVEWFNKLAARLGVSRTESAAVGDSAGDFPMLLAAGRGFYVGTDPPPISVKHVPCGDIDEIARELLRVD